MKSKHPSVVYSVRFPFDVHQKLERVAGRKRGVRNGLIVRAVSELTDKELLEKKRNRPRHQAA